MGLRMLYVPGPRNTIPPPAETAAPIAWLIPREASPVPSDGVDSGENTGRKAAFDDGVWVK
jgi:hypothetical protein